MILADVVDLAVRCFKNGGDPGDLRCLREPGELVGGHGQVGVWGLVDVVALNTDKFVIGVSVAFLTNRAEPRLAQGQPHLLSTEHG